MIITWFYIYLKNDGEKKTSYQGIVMYVWDATSGQLERSEGVYSAGRSIITKSGVQCEADEEAKMFEETLNSQFF